MLFVLTVAMTLVACQPEELRPPQNQFAENSALPADIPSQQSDEPMAPEAIVDAVSELTGDGVCDFKWEDADDYMMWSAAVAGDGLLAIGYKAVGYSDEDLAGTIHQVNLSAPEWTAARASLIEDVISSMKDQFPDEEFTEASLEVEDVPHLPIFQMRLTNYQALATVRRNARFRFSEPLKFNLCGYAYPNLMNSISWAICESAESPGNFVPNSSQSSLFYHQGQPYHAKVSWHLDKHNIPEAWEVSRGQGITIGMLDTGIELDQDLLQTPGFTFGPSANRSIQSDFTYTGPTFLQNDSDDRCSHGTTIAGQIAGPVNDDYAIVGVAYQANLHSVRIANDFHIHSAREVLAYINGMTLLANDPNVRIINSSVGRLCFSYVMRDAINYADGKEKLLVCAAGSALRLGSYPAKYAKTVAVTSVRHEPVSDPNGTNLIVAGMNAKGSFVDFAVYLRQPDDDWALGLAKDGPEPVKAKGSSAGAATVSGMAALVWAANPSLSRFQVMQILEQNASYFPNKDNSFGWGIINAEDAVDDAAAIMAPLSATINGPMKFTSSGNYTWSAQVSNASGNVTYSWKLDGTPVGGNSPTLTHYLTHGNMCSYNLELTLTTTSGQNTTQTETILCW